MFLGGTLQIRKAIFGDAVQFRDAENLQPGIKVLLPALTIDEFCDMINKMAGKGEQIWSF